MNPYGPDHLTLGSIDWPAHVTLIGQANAALARYDGMLQSIVNPAVLLSPLTIQEAVLSSRIEGTQASMEEVLEFEADSREPMDPARRLIFTGQTLYSTRASPEIAPAVSWTFYEKRGSSKNCVRHVAGAEPSWPLPSCYALQGSSVASDTQKPRCVARIAILCHTKQRVWHVCHTNRGGAL